MVSVAQFFLILCFSINCILPLVTLGFPWLILFYFLVSYSGLFPGKLAATAFNNKIELFEKPQGLFKCQRCQSAAGGLQGVVSPSAWPGDH